MRIALVGLGDIARKAYLPTFAAMSDVELVLCSRNSSELLRLATCYRIRECATEVAALASMQIAAAFVHTATESHEAAVCELLRQGIHVYVDKPLAYDVAAAARMVALAESQRCRLMVGFNRRFAPMYEAVAHQPNRRLVLLQKHRPALADVARRVVFDDFIHVVDTLRFMAPGPIDTVKVNGAIHDGLLHSLVVHLDGAGFSLLGIMDRDSGATEETLEVMSPGNKWRVQSLSQTIHAHAGAEHITNAGDWQTTLARRGFPQIVEHFLRCIKTNESPRPSAQDSLATHLLCERIVAELEAAGATSLVL